MTVLPPRRAPGLQAGGNAGRGRWPWRRAAPLPRRRAPGR